MKREKPVNRSEEMLTAINAQYIFDAGFAILFEGELLVFSAFMKTLSIDQFACIEDCTKEDLDFLLRANLEQNTAQELLGNSKEIYLKELENHLEIERVRNRIKLLNEQSEEEHRHDIKQFISQLNRHEGYEIITNEDEITKGIKCLKCDHTSWLPMDVKYRFTACCKFMHIEQKYEHELPKFYRYNLATKNND